MLQACTTGADFLPLAALPYFLTTINLRSVIFSNVSDDPTAIFNCVC
jgi:hypothetical protein